MGADGRSWAADCLWELRTGANSLAVKTRNKWGRSGPESRIALSYAPSELVYETVDSIAVPDPSFEGVGGYFNSNRNTLPDGSWHLIASNEYQMPASWGPVMDNPNNGWFCWKIGLAEPPVWAKLVSPAFRVNPASDIRVTAWLRADSDGREVTLFVMDESRGGAGRQAVAHTRVKVDRQWRQFEISARLGTQSTHVSVGVQVMEGAVWADDFAVEELSRAELPWGK